ncbi:conserved hypothetical protein [Talaromyces stipitatus ATCC 10500]|uniref:Endosomal SPRY domain protein n=1 Tax=Talaromyces stipitatus (strain ATCC 10500 / CBS 375.48 / QM 6759 / NRRL 1006) TaxID=441959 RepID=B8M5G5_TALSN|nr:uncharacterized protein TSTA_030380 [Talaromyces stipitatus ATCC 10500]EED19771.1 conserved hypothetical protein [Talaromyces stipitatus ATCC 10500]
MPPYIVPGADVVDNASDGTRTLVSRASTKTAVVGGQGTISPDKINMQGMLALFAILGAAFVLATIWFFFWAKNGGCVFRKGDWEDYKSTVLRRKGPDGRTLSNATASTDLGGGTIRGYDDDNLTYTDMTETATEITNEKESARGGRKNKRNLKETAKEKLLRRTKAEKWEGEADDDMRAYRQEKPARVGGINREAEGTYYGTEYTPSSPPTAYTESEVYRSPPQPEEDRRRRDTRNVSGFSFTAGSEDVISQATEEHLIRDPAHTRREARRQRREREERRSRQNSPRKQHQTNRTSMPGGYTEPLDFSSRGTNSEYQYSTVDTEDDLGTRSYHHPIPGLSKGYRRDRDGGGRRRRDSLSDSE